jgi:hypothetical protein
MMVGPKGVIREFCTYASDKSRLICSKNKNKTIILSIDTYNFHTTFRSGVTFSANRTFFLLQLLGREREHEEDGRTVLSKLPINILKIKKYKIMSDVKVHLYVLDTD